MKKKSKVSILVLIFLLITVFYPLVEMLLKVEWSDFGNLIASRSFKEALSNSLFVTSISTIISILIAYLLLLSFLMLLFLLLLYFSILNLTHT